MGMQTCARLLRCKQVYNVLQLYAVCQLWGVESSAEQFKLAPLVPPSPGCRALLSGAESIARIAIVV
jgi:hypothetical protein